MKKLYGWFDLPSDSTPSYDPPKFCLFCTKEIVLGESSKTISLMKNGSKKSFFYRVHRTCKEASTDEEVTLYESSIIDNE